VKRKCISCGEVKPLTDFHRQYKYGSRRYVSNECKICKEARTRQNNKKRWSTEIGFLNWKYENIKQREKKGMNYQCFFTFEEFCGAFEKHKEKLGMRSAWGPPHLPITMIYLGTKENKNKRTGSNLSPDRLDSSKPYTIQNLIFIRADENSRKKDATYNDCLAQVRLHEERFKNEI